MRADLHVHSNVSFDSDAPMTDTARVAVERGLDVICFTDHCDPINEEKPDELCPGCYDGWQKGYAEVEKARRAYGKELEILHGMELGELHRVPEMAAKCNGAPDLDFLIGSVHMLPGMCDFYYLDYPDMETCQKLTEIYLDENICVAEKNVADIIAHIGYNNRYMSRRGFSVELMDYQDRLKKLFSILVQNGRGIEVNTSGLRQGAGSTFPGLSVLRLYRQCGGEIITIGSDSHNSQDVGSDIDLARELLEEAGFTYMAVFRKRKPYMIKLT